MENILASVGSNGKNQTSDVTLIQKLLNQNKVPGEVILLKIDGKIGSKTIKRIEAFQRKIIFMVRPDGRVDPNGKTFKKLIIVRVGSKKSNTFTLSAKAINLLKDIEELATKPYDDQTGKEISNWVEGATIGYGHLILKDEWGKYKNGISESQALTLFKTDIQPFSSKVKGVIKTTITQNEFDALVILTFNIGVNGFGTSSVLKLINDPTARTSYLSLEAAWKAWNKSQGKISNGLKNRRQAEWNIYTKNIYKKW